MDAGQFVIGRRAVDDLRDDRPDIGHIHELADIEPGPVPGDVLLHGEQQRRNLQIKPERQLDDEQVGKRDGDYGYKDVLVHDPYKPE